MPAGGLHTTPMWWDSFGQARAWFDADILLPRGGAGGDVVGPSVAGAWVWAANSSAPSITGGPVAPSVQTQYRWLAVARAPVFSGPVVESIGSYGEEAPRQVPRGLVTRFAWLAARVTPLSSAMPAELAGWPVSVVAPLAGQTAVPASEAGANEIAALRKDIDSLRSELKALRALLPRPSVPLIRTRPKLSRTRS